MPLELAGYLEQHTRKTTSKRFAERGGVKSFWSITSKGIEFGKNMVAPKSPRETVPHWYVHKFDELRELVRPFSRGDATGWGIGTDTGKLPLLGAVDASIRQIAHETLRTFQRRNPELLLACPYDMCRQRASQAVSA